jgi:hypothetical protein
MGACAVAKRAGVSDFIAIDMGGTSYEACLIKGGTPRIRSFWNWQHRYLVGLPMVEMHSIGAGGGSIAYVQAGALRVGPESAKADPGPICYGRGGTRPTVTDANLCSHQPEAPAAEASTQGVREAIRADRGSPGLDVVEAAHGIFRIVNANMANAIRRVPRGGQSVRLHGGVWRHGLCTVRRRTSWDPRPAGAEDFLSLHAGSAAGRYVVDTQRSTRPVAPGGPHQRLSRRWSARRAGARAAGSRADLVFHRF